MLLDHHCSPRQQYTAHIWRLQYGESHPVHVWLRGSECMCFCFFSDQFITDAKLVYAFGGSYYGKDSRIVGRRTAERENNHGPCLGQQIITATHTVGRSQLICKYCKLIRFWVDWKKRGFERMFTKGCPDLSIWSVCCGIQDFELPREKISESWWR